MPYPPLRNPSRPLFFKPRCRPWKAALALLILAVAAAAVVTLLRDLPSQAVLVGPPNPLALAPTLPAEQFDPSDNLFARKPEVSQNGQDTDNKTLTGQVRPGQTLNVILGRHLAADKQASLNAPEDFSFSELRSGQPYRLTLRDRELVSFEYDISPSELLVIDETDGELAARVETRQCEVRPTLLRATISTNLSEAVTEAGGNISTALALADVFASDLDCSRDLQPGDVFEAVVEERYVEDKSAGLGRVLAARYVGEGRTLEGFGQRGNKGKLEYYDAKGRPLRKAFLRAPLSFLRVTSGFTSSRLHPILKVRKPHYGVDYAAPTGTPVWTVGDGVVIERGRNHAAGNYVTIRHNKTYVTRYNHLSRFAKGLAPGTRVVQGQVIGHVGATGFATGPHLDFRMYANGRPVNTLTNHEATADALPPARLAELRDDILTLTSVLDGLTPPTALADNQPRASNQ